MVYAFLIQNVSTTPTSSTTGSNATFNLDDPSSGLLQSTDASVILATFYSPEGNDEKKRQRIRLISQQVHQEYVFRLSLYAPAHPSAMDEVTGRSASRPLRDLDGEFLMGTNEAISNPKVVVWHHVGR